MDGIDAINTIIRAEFQRHRAPWFSARAWNLQKGDLDFEVPGNREQDNQLLKNVYPEIDIYAHARSTAQFRTGEGICCQQLMPQLSASFTRGTERAPVNHPAGYNVQNNNRC